MEPQLHDRSSDDLAPLPPRRGGDGPTMSSVAPVYHPPRAPSPSEAAAIAASSFRTRAASYHDDHRRGQCRKLDHSRPRRHCSRTRKRSPHQWHGGRFTQHIRRFHDLESPGGPESSQTAAPSGGTAFDSGICCRRGAFHWRSTSSSSRRWRRPPFRTKTRSRKPSASTRRWQDTARESAKR